MSLSEYGPSSLSDPSLPPIQMSLEHQLRVGDKFTNINDNSVVEIVSCLNDIVRFKCIKCHRDGCKNKEITYEIEYFDRVFNPIV